MPTTAEEVLLPVKGGPSGGGGTIPQTVSGIN